MKLAKRTLIILASLSLLVFGAFQFMKYNTKKASPERLAEYAYNDAKLSVFYCSPAKNGRAIFGELVPFEEVWRTGANEASTFSSTTDFLFDETRLPAGTYTLWTIPGPADWTIILNSKKYGWGLGFDGKANRDPAYDVAIVNAPVQELDREVENFTIDFEHDVNLTLAWDRTKVSVPIAINQ